nr:hypothetical protein [Tanacetum cinerariifolium]
DDQREQTHGDENRTLSPADMKQKRHGDQDDVEQHQLAKRSFAFERGGQTVKKTTDKRRRWRLVQRRSKKCEERPLEAVNSAETDTSVGRNRFHLLQEQSCLSARSHVQLAKDRGHMGLDGCFGHTQFIGNLFVQQAFTDHGQYAELLRGEAGEPLTGGLGLRRDADIFVSADGFSAHDGIGKGHLFYGASERRKQRQRTQGVAFKHSCGAKDAQRTRGGQVRRFAAQSAPPNLPSA